MSRKLLLDDFRAVRLVLEAHDFALSPDEPDSPPEDLVDEATRRDLVTLPDTAAFFTSNDHGGELQLMSDLWAECIEHFPPEADDERLTAS